MQNVSLHMTYVEHCTVEGELYTYNGFRNRILLSPFGAFEIDDDGCFNGKIVPFQARQLQNKEQCVDDSFSMDAYMADESLFIPLNTVDEYQLSQAYVVNEGQLVTLGNAKFLHPEKLGGDHSNEQVIEVYTHATPKPYSVEDRMDAELVHQRDVIELFREHTIETVQPI